MPAIRRTLVVVAGVFACAVHAVPARAQPQAGWDMALTGGFVASGLVDPVFALGNVSGQPVRVVVREHDQESTVNLSVAMFAQIYNDRLAVGGADLDRHRHPRRFARHAVHGVGAASRYARSVTGGVAIGPVSALPAGTVEGRAVIDTNVLSNLITRTTHSWFAGVTYTFASLR